ncbi:MAG: universal stress protein [Acidobacteriia bacterium]|nr:universal stress protein [Terriglobia bacterium]
MKILLAIDASPESAVVAEQIAARPWPSGSTFAVLSVVEPSHLWTTSEVAMEFARRADEAVKNAVTQLQSKGWKVDGSVLSGDPKGTILNAAKGADFICVGSHRSSLTRFLAGSVGTAVLRYAPCSVGVIRGKAPAGAMKILLATDGSEFSDEAARSIGERPWPAGTEVRVLSAVEMILPATRALLEPPFIDSEFLETARAEAMKRSQDAIAQARQILSNVGLQTSDSLSVLLDPPRTIIAEEASRWPADLIVLGSHGHSAIDRFLLGSVSESVALHAPCSVEVIRKRVNAPPERSPAV